MQVKQFLNSDNLFEQPFNNFTLWIGKLSIRCKSHHSKITPVSKSAKEALCSKMLFLQSVLCPFYAFALPPL